MKTLLKQVLITPGNYPRIYARVIPQEALSTYSGLHLHE
jgi:hypothetical protein